MNGTLKFRFALAFLLAAFALGGCGPKFEEMSPSEIYDFGEKEFFDRDFSDAIEAYEALIDLYPFSVFVTQAELRIADSYFGRKRWPEASVAYEDFLDRHPTNDAVPHCLHNLGLSHYHQKLAIDRDQGETHAAETALGRLVTHYPDYKEDADAREKLGEVRKDLASRERYIGRFYWREKEYYAALKRFQRVIRDYPDTVFYPEALYYGAMCLKNLEEHDEAGRYFNLLLKKFPDHKYAKKARKTFAGEK